jgi:glycosyltransferase involved in cell wall biosynthesis
VIGDGDFMPEVRRLVDELHLADRVELLGAQPPDRVRAELARASVFVQHSVTAASGDKEGWPVSIAEAAASGLPIVSTRHASIPEQVEHEESGLLCNEGDWRTMGEHMRRLAGNATLRRSMGAAARSRIEPFDTGRQIAMLEDVLVAAAES